MALARAANSSGVALVALLLSSAAVAQAPASLQVQARLIIDAPTAKCPSEASLRAQIRGCLRPEAARAGHRLVAEVRITEVANTLEGRLRMMSGGATMGERRLIGAHDCGALVEAAALAMCIALDAMAAARPVAPARAVTATDGHPAGVPPGPQPQAPGPAEVRRIGFSGGAMVSGGIQPGAALGLALGADLLWQGTGVGLELRYERPSATAVDAGELRSWLVAGSALICGRAAWFGFCGVGSAGFRHTAGVGFDQDDGATSAYAAVGLRVLGQWRLSRTWAIVGSAQASRSLIGVDAVLDGRPVWSSPPVGVLAGLALAWRPDG